MYETRKAGYSFHNRCADLRKQRDNGSLTEKEHSDLYQEEYRKYREFLRNRWNLLCDDARSVSGRIFDKLINSNGMYSHILATVRLSVGDGDVVTDSNFKITNELATDAFYEYCIFCQETIDRNPELTLSIDYEVVKR